MIFPSLIIKVERWKFSKEYGVYVSTLGNFKDRYKRRLPVKINTHGYCCVKTEQGFKLSHRLVMITWKPIPDAENLTVDHLNHNKRDNSVQNLEWVTKKENLRRAEKDYYRGAVEEKIVSFSLSSEEEIKGTIDKAMANLPKCTLGQIQKGQFTEDHIREVFTNKLTRFVKSDDRECRAYGLVFIKNNN